ncbi:hypothetical protein, partial [Pseudomonas syringae]
GRSLALSVNVGHYNEPAGVCQSDGKGLRSALSGVYICAQADSRSRSQMLARGRLSTQPEIGQTQLMLGGASGQKQTLETTAGHTHYYARIIS